MRITIEHIGVHTDYHPPKHWTNGTIAWVRVPQESNGMETMATVAHALWPVSEKAVTVREAAQCLRDNANLFTLNPHREEKGWRFYGIYLHKDDPTPLTGR